MAKPEKSTKKTISRTKVSRTVKLERKLNGTSAKTPFSMKTGLFTVTGFTSGPVEIPGYLVERSATHVVFRHKVSNASKKMVVSVFSVVDVLEQHGDVLKPGSITVNKRKSFTTATGTLKFSGNDIIVKNEDGDITTFSQNGIAEYEIKAFDLEGSQSSGRGVKASEKTVKKSSKVTDIKDGKKKVKK